MGFVRKQKYVKHVAHDLFSCGSSHIEKSNQMYLKSKNNKNKKYTLNLYFIYVLNVVNYYLKIKKIQRVNITNLCYNMYLYIQYT